MLTENQLVDLFNIRYKNKSRFNRTIYYVHPLMLGHYLMRNIFGMFDSKYIDAPFTERFSKYSWDINSPASFYIPIELRGPVDKIGAHVYQFMSSKPICDINGHFKIEMKYQRSFDLFEDEKECCFECKRRNNQYFQFVTINKKIPDRPEASEAIDRALYTIELFETLIGSIDRMIVRPEIYERTPISPLLSFR